MGGERPGGHALRGEGTGIPLSGHRAGGVRWLEWGKGLRLGRVPAATPVCQGGPWRCAERTGAGQVVTRTVAVPSAHRPSETRGVLTLVQLA